MSKSQANLGKFVWHTLVTRDVAAAKKFYGQLLGWTHADQDMGPGGKYTLFRVDGKDVGGARSGEPGMPSHWAAYPLVESVNGVADRAPALGGKVLVPPTDIPGVGRFAVVADPQGATFAAFESGPNAPQEEVDTPPAVGAFCWDELHTTDPDAATAFYAKLLGYTTQTHDMGPAGSYTMLRRGDKERGGMMKSAMNASFWLSYVLVANVDATTDKARGLGATVIVEPRDIPGFGRFSVLTDPTGASIALWKNAK